MGLFSGFNKSITLLLIIVSLLSCSSAHVKEKKDVEDIIPLTMANMRGHQALYNEGYFVITSSKEALEYAKEKSVVSSRQAVLSAVSSIASRNSQFASAIKSDVSDSVELSAQTFSQGTRLTRKIFSQTNKISTMQIDYGRKNLSKAWHSLIKGNLYIGKRTQETREALLSQPGNYFKNLNDDFSNIYDLTADMQIDFAQRIGDTWSGAFSKASQSFSDEYEASGQSNNAIGGLFHIIKGYMKGLYQGLFKPVANTAADTVSAGARGVAQVAFLPTATVVSVAGRTVQAIGTTVYYSGKLGVEVISPTIEAGFLSGLSMLSLGTVPLTYVTGAAIGSVNQVAFTTAAPVVGVASAAVTSAVDTGKYVAFVSYDAIAGTTKVVINQASAGVVLGYNALLAIPTHLILGVFDSAVFLAYDGPRLVIASAKGEIGNASSERIDSLPVGSVVDLNALKQKGIDVKIVSDDAAVIKNVVEALPGDFRE
ncbi:MAG: hypothetical protein OEY11_03800 [Gammaproteobacteria bacterium]|nr:hypothetical protein [Gammaproteobacteria bacterium]